MSDLIPCRSCKKEVEFNIQECPYCHEKHPTGTYKDLIVVIVIIALIIWGIFSYFSNDNSKQIFKKDYGEKWAFTSDEATLECYEDGDIKSPVVVVNGNAYGLTGFADAKYGQGDIKAFNRIWLKSEKYQGLYVGIGIFTDEALELCD